jgi:hypothetical protein
VKRPGGEGLDPGLKLFGNECLKNLGQRILGSDLLIARRFIDKGDDADVRQPFWKN